MQTKANQSTPLSVAEPFPAAAVDRPALAKRTADFKRFSGDDMFTIYRPLKTERAGECSFRSRASRQCRALFRRCPRGRNSPGRDLAIRRI